MDDRDIFIQTKQGQFEYDADYDIYRRRPEPRDLTHFQQFGWIYVLAILTVIAYYVTLIQG